MGSVYVGYHQIEEFILVSDAFSRENLPLQRGWREFRGSAKITRFRN